MTSAFSLPETPRFARRLLITTAIVLAGTGSLWAQSLGPGMADEPVAIYNAAIAAFDRGDWQAAIAGIERSLASVADPEQKKKLGPAYFTLASAYFNAGNFAQATQKFESYIAQFPQGEKVGEARMGVARASFLGKDYVKAAALWAQLEKVPALREMALTAQAVCFRETGKPDLQIGVLERLIAPEIKTFGQAGGAVALAQLYLDRDKDDKALALVNQLYIHVGLVSNVVALNMLTVQLGDNLAEKKFWSQALAAYHAVRTRAEVIAFQQDRIAAMDKRLLVKADALSQKQLTAEREQAVKLLETFTKQPDHGPGVLLRMAKVWFDQGKKWEAAVVFEEFLTLYPEGAEAEQAMYSQLVCFAELNRVMRAQKLCERYLAKFPAGKKADAVDYLRGAMALQSNNPKQAISFFGVSLQKQPDGAFASQMRLALGNARLMIGEFEEARKDYRALLAKDPGGPFAEEAQYRETLATLSLGEYEKALGMLDSYRKKYPQGSFVADSGYRTMVCKYAASLYEEIVADAKRWQQQHANDPMTGEVCALLGDALAALDRRDEAVAAYTQAFQSAQTDEVLNYALFEAGKQLQKLGKWDAVARLFEEFVQAKPDHPTVVGAMFWIGRAKAREGKTEEAKKFLVSQLERYLNAPKREAVEQLLQQLVQLCAKRPRAPKPAEDALPPATTPPAATVASATAAPSTTPAATPPPATPPPAPPLPPYDAVAELRKQLEPLVAGANTTGRARLLYAEAELATLRKQPEEVQKIYLEITARFKADDMSPLLLARGGEYLLAKGNQAKSREWFEALREDFPKSDYLDYAYVGLGQLAMEAKKPAEALELFAYAADELAASQVKQATLGKAAALLELGRFEESKKLFEQVASVHEWRGESTAQAVFSLGEVEARQGRLAEAIVYYQRVFVAYQKYQSWAAKAYLRAAENFEKLGKRKEAIAHLEEMLRNEKLAKFPETAEAKKLLGKWGAPV